MSLTHTGLVTNQEQQPRSEGIDRPEKPPYKKAKKEKPWKPPTRIT